MSQFRKLSQVQSRYRADVKRMRIRHCSDVLQQMGRDALEADKPTKDDLSRFGLNKAEYEKARLLALECCE